MYQATNNAIIQACVLRTCISFVLNQQSLMPDLEKKTVRVLFFIKEYICDPVTYYNYVEGSKVSVSIKRSNANKCT